MVRFKHARRTPFTSVLRPLLFNRLFGWPFQAEYAINRLSEKIYSGSEAVNGSVIIENRTKYLYYIIAARIVIRYQCITAWKAVLVPYALFYSEKGLVKMRLIAKIYEIYDKYNMRQ